MKLKKCIISVLCVSMAFEMAQVAKGYVYETAAQHMDVMTLVNEIDNALLARHARAKSEMSSPVGQDGPASWAFDDQDHWWHTKWKNEQNNEGKPSASNPIWIQTGFGGVKKIKKMTYLPRANGYGTIQNYSVQYANTNKADSALVDSDFHEIKSGRLNNVRQEQTIEWPEAVEATHIRLVATGPVYTNGGQNYVMAKRIRVFEEKEYDILKHTQNWDYERSKGTLRTQTDDDMWYSQVQNISNSEWINLPDNAFNGTTWMQTGNSANAKYYYGKLARDEMTATLGNLEGNKYKALAFTWKAPRNGYFRVTLENPIGDAGGSLNGFVKYSKDTTDGTLLWKGAFNLGIQLESKIAKMSRGEFLRIGANKNDAWATGFQPMVVEVKASEYAPQYIEEVDNFLLQHQDIPAILKDEASNLKAELAQLLTLELKDEEAIDAKINELETVLLDM